MINPGRAPDQSRAHEPSFVRHLLLEHVVLLAFVVVVGCLALAEASGLFAAFVHEISLVA